MRTINTNALEMPTTILCNESEEGETIEQKMRRVLENNEPISEVTDLVFTERAEGVIPEYNIRTDKWDEALDAMDKSTNAHKQRREELKKLKEDKQKPETKKEPTPENKPE